MQKICLKNANKQRQQTNVSLTTKFVYRIKKSEKMLSRQKGQLMQKLWNNIFNTKINKTSLASYFFFEEI
jgi:hypothetical protein